MKTTFASDAATASSFPDGENATPSKRPRTPGARMCWTGCGSISNRDARVISQAFSLSDPDRLQYVGEFLRDLATQLRRSARDLRKVLDAFPGAAGIDHGARIGGACLVEDGIERPRPRAAEGLDVLRRIAARADRPHHVEQVGRINV